MNRSALHTALCRDIECALSRLPDVYTTANPSGVADYRGARVSYGAFGLGDGAPDILAVRRCELFELRDGIYVPVVVGVLHALEAKTGAAVQSEAQRRAQRRLERVGARYVVARCVEDAVRVVGAVRGGGE